MLRSTYTRVAVVQLDYHPAAIIQRRSPLEDPLFALGSPDSLPDVLPSDLHAPAAQLRSRIRAGYLEQLRIKLRAILETCRRWQVQLVVLPEYAVPWELLPELAEIAGEMVVVAGTHTVERAERRAGVYEQLGWATDRRPRSGTAVAPVLHDGRLLALVPKLSAAKPEQGSLLVDPQASWEPITFDPVSGPAIPGPLGVMICLDFLYREREAHRERVGSGLDRCRYLAVPSFTPHFTNGEFGAKGWEEAKRYGRPVLYANLATEGGTTIFVDEGRPSELRGFPQRVGLLEAGDEGVIVADVDLGYVRSGGSTRYGEDRVLVPFAAASLVYRNHPISARYADWSAELDARLEDDEHELDALADTVEQARELLLDTASLSGAGLRQQRLHRLLAELDRVNQHEELRRFTREVLLPPEALPLPIVQGSLAHGAGEVLFEWTREHRGQGLERFEPRLREAGIRLQELGEHEKTPAALSNIARISRSVVGGREREKQAVEEAPVRVVVPVDARLRDHEAAQDGFRFRFRQTPQELVGLRSPARGRQRGIGPSLEMLGDLWLAARAQGHADATVIGVEGGDDSALLVIHHHEGGRRVLAANWGIGSKWIAANRPQIATALAQVCAGVTSIDLIEQPEFEAELERMLERFSGATTTISRVIDRRLGETGGAASFVGTYVEREGKIVDALTALDDWLDRSRDGVAFVLGPFGIGKSTLLATWARRRHQYGGPQPLLVDLAGVRAQSPIGMLLEAAGRSPDDAADRAALSLLIERGRLLPCLDGFDEMATRLAFDDIPGELAPLLALAGARGRVLLTSRDHYFVSEGHRHRAIDHAVAKAGLQGIAELRLQRFSWAQVQELVEKVIHGASEQARVLAKIRDTYDLADLVQTPLLLAMVLQTIDDIDPRARVGSATIYEEYLERWLRQTQSGAPETFSSAQKRAFAKVLAAELWRSGQRSCSWEQLHASILGGMLRELPTDTPAEAAFLEIQGGSFFVRDGDQRFRFAHKSFLEFFLAQALLEGLVISPAKTLDTQPLTPEVAAFVAELLRASGEGRRHAGIVALERWLLRGRALEGIAETANAAANALRLLRDLQRAFGDEAAWVPAGADLRGISLDPEELRGVALADARLDEAGLYGVDFEGAKLRGSSLQGARLQRARSWERAPVDPIFAPNPFAPGAALDSPTRPPGRDRELARILNTIAHDGSVRVIGPRRVGKTSLRNYLRHHFDTPEHQRSVHTVTLQGAQHSIREPADLARLLLPELPPEHPDPATALLTLLDQETAPLLLLDELGRLAHAGSDLFTWLRALGQEHAPVVYFGSLRDWTRVMAKADRVGSSFGNDVREIELARIPEQAAIEFLLDTSPADAKIPEPVARWIVDRCGAWPFYLQVMGEAVVEELRFGSRKVLHEHAAFTELYRRSLPRGSQWSSFFISLWDDIPPPAQRIVLRELDKLREHKRASLPSPGDLGRDEQDYLEQVGLIAPDHGWTIDRPFLDWLLLQRALPINTEPELEPEIE